MLTVNRNKKKRNATVKQNMTLNYVLLRVFLTRLMYSGGSRPSDRGEGVGGGHPDPEIRGGGGAVSKNVFSALRVSVRSTNKGGGGGAGPPRPSPGSATDEKYPFFA